MKLNNISFVYCVTECLIIIVLVKASDYETTTGAPAPRWNLSFDKEPYGRLFSSDGYPKPGDIPMLNRKVFRGMRVSIIEHPYIVSIRRNYAHYLTGTLLNLNVIVTVAHPVVGIPLIEFNIVLGENYADRGSKALTVILLIVHENFDPYTLDSDIALMRIYETLYYRVAVRPVAGLFESRISYVNKRAFVSGWGRCDMTGRELCLPRSSIYFRDEKLDPMLRTITFEIKETNQLTYCEGYKRHETNVRKGMLCMGAAREDNPVSPCLAVPGAPLVVDGKLLGIQSWGFGCGYNHDLPLVYTDVRYYHHWINNNIKILKKIRTANMSILFEATKAQKIYEWLVLTRKYVALAHDHQDKELQPIELDQLLAKINGNVYDLRDFFDQGKYHQSKTDMYERIRIRNNRTSKVKKLFDIKRKKSLPFIRHKMSRSKELKATTNSARADLNSNLNDDMDEYKTLYSGEHPSSNDDGFN